MKMCEYNIHQWNTESQLWQWLSVTIAASCLCQKLRNASCISYMMLRMILRIQTSGPCNLIFCLQKGLVLDKWGQDVNNFGVNSPRRDDDMAFLKMSESALHKFSQELGRHESVLVRLSSWSTVVRCCTPARTGVSIFMAPHWDTEPGVLPYPKWPV